MPSSVAGAQKARQGPERLSMKPAWVHTRGAVIHRVFSHDVYHIAELNESLGRAGLTQIDLWD